MARPLYWLLIDTGQCLTNNILHSIGGYLLIHIYRNQRKTPQKLILINLAISELLRNFVHLLHEIIDIARKYEQHESFFVEAHHYVQFVRKSGCMLQVYCAMLILTGDRLCGIYLNVRYPRICTIRRTWFVMTTTWLVNMAIAACVCVVYALTGDRKFSFVFHRYVDVALSIFFTIFACFTYTYIFMKNTRSLVHRSNSTWRLKAYTILRQTNYSMILLLIISFIILTVIPELLATVLRLMYVKNKAVNIYVSLSLNLSDTIDAVIYVFLQKDVRVLFKRTFCCCWYSAEDLRQSKSSFSVITTPTLSVKKLSASSIRALNHQVKRGTFNSVRLLAIREETLSLNSRRDVLQTSADSSCNTLVGRNNKPV